MEHERVAVGHVIHAERDFGHTRRLVAGAQVDLVDARYASIDVRENVPVVDVVVCATLMAVADATHPLRRGTIREHDASPRFGHTPPVLALHQLISAVVHDLRIGECGVRLDAHMPDRQIVRHPDQLEAWGTNAIDVRDPHDTRDHGRVALPKDGVAYIIVEEARAHRVSGPEAFG